MLNGSFFTWDGPFKGSNKALTDNDLITEDKTADKKLIIVEVTLLDEYSSSIACLPSGFYTQTVRKKYPRQLI